MPSTLTDSDADRILRAWIAANAPPGFGGTDAEPDDGPCEPPGSGSGGATCPACGLGGIPVTGGKLAAHAWHRGELEHLGTEDAPEPGRWIGGCENRDPGPLPASGD